MDFGLWDEDDEDEAEFVDHAHDESMVSGLMGMIDMTLFYKEFRLCCSSMADSRAVGRRSSCPCGSVRSQFVRGR
jgi:hypothetical protein